MGFAFIDLFAGIGGMRMGFERAGGRCVYSSELDRFARRTYEANFGDRPDGDIRHVDACTIPDHDVLLAGFPCQPFSAAGVSSNRYHGQPNGFADRTRGTLFFEVCRIIRAKRPRAFLLENVKNLKMHDSGRTFRVMLDSLRTLGYDVHHTILDAARLVPQHRERLFIAGFDTPTRFEFPRIVDQKPKLRDILESTVHPKYTLSDRAWRGMLEHRRRHRSRGSGFGYDTPDHDGISHTLLARYHKNGSEILIRQRRKNPRRLTPRECAHLMGFPERFKIVVSDTQAYRQFGNAVVPPVIYHIAQCMVPHLGGCRGGSCAVLDLAV